MEYLHGLLSSGAAGGLRLYARGDQAIGPASPGRAAPGPAPIAPSRLAHPHSVGLGSTSTAEPNSLVVDTLAHVCWAALFHALHDRADPSGVVCPHGSSLCAGPVLSLRGEQSGKHSGPAELPDPVG